MLQRLPLVQMLVALLRLLVLLVVDLLEVKPLDLDLDLDALAVQDGYAELYSVQYQLGLLRPLHLVLLPLAELLVKVFVPILFFV